MQKCKNKKNKSYRSSYHQNINKNILIKIRLYSGIKATWQLSHTWFIFWEFRQTGKTGKNTPNNLGYTENISNSPTPRSASDKVFRLIFIQPFWAINLIWWSILIKKWRNIAINQHFLIKRNVENQSLLYPFRLP